MRRCAHGEVPQLLTLRARNAAHFKVQPHAVRAIGAVYRKAFLGPIHGHMERQVFSRHWLYHFPLVWDALAPLFCVQKRKPRQVSARVCKMLTTPAVMASARTNTIGIVDVASLRARTGTGEAATITSGFSATSSDANCETGPALPAAVR